jgi:hypothetical protein
MSRRSDYTHCEVAQMLGKSESVSGPKSACKKSYGIDTGKRAAGQEIEDGIMLSPRRLEAAFHCEKETQTSPEDRPKAAGS